MDAKGFKVEKRGSGTEGAWSESTFHLNGDMLK